VTVAGAANMHSRFQAGPKSLENGKAEYVSFSRGGGAAPGCWTSGLLGSGCGDAGRGRGWARVKHIRGS
jgi:hypothetical protein